MLRSASDTVGYIAGKRRRDKAFGRTDMDARAQAGFNDEARLEGDALSRPTVGSLIRPESPASITSWSTQTGDTKKNQMTTNASRQDGTVTSRETPDRRRQREGAATSRPPAARRKRPMPMWTPRFSVTVTDPCFVFSSSTDSIFGLISASTDQFRIYYSCSVYLSLQYQQWMFSLQLNFFLSSCLHGE